MSLTKFNESVSNIQTLPDTPTLTPAQLKALFDKAGIDIKAYINSTLTNEIDSKFSELTQKINTMYPVGSIYMSVNNTNPGTLFGGTWEAWGAGKVPVGVNLEETEFDEVEKTGGEKQHVLSISEMPEHQHNIQGLNSTGESVLWSERAVSYGDNNLGFSAGIKTNYTGSGQAHNNLQPYITCYMWKRIA